MRRALLAGAAVSAAALSRPCRRRGRGVVVRATVDRRPSVSATRSSTRRGARAADATRLRRRRRLRRGGAAADGPLRGGKVVAHRAAIACLDRAARPAAGRAAVALPRRARGQRTAAAPARRSTVTLDPRVPRSAVKASRARYRSTTRFDAAGARRARRSLALVLLAASAVSPRRRSSSLAASSGGARRLAASPAGAARARASPAARIGAPSCARSSARGRLRRARRFARAATEASDRVAWSRSRPAAAGGRRAR